MQTNHSVDQFLLIQLPLSQSYTFFFSSLIAKFSNPADLGLNLFPRCTEKVALEVLQIMLLTWMDHIQPGEVSLQMSIFAQNH